MLKEMKNEIDAVIVSTTGSNNPCSASMMAMEIGKPV